MIGLNFVDMLKELLGSFYIPKIGFGDVVEILILMFTLYKLGTNIAKTRAMSIVRGILCMFLIYLISYLFGFDVIVVIFQNLITVCLLACVLIFQPELRKFIEKIGTEQKNKTIKLGKILFKNNSDGLWYSDKTINELVDACDRMAKVKTGVLIVIERDIPLTEYITSGININADITSALLINIFEKNTPLHDGAVIMEGNKVVSATCYLPLSSNGNIDKNMGTRHRAAIGVSEVTDCIVLVVSEETGAISFIQDGKIKHGIGKEQLRKELKRLQAKSVVKENKKIENPLKLLRHNIGLKLTTSVVAILGWVVLMNVYNPVDTKEFKGIPVTVDNGSVLTSINKTYEINRDIVDVKVSTTRRELDRIGNSDIKVIADLKNLTLANTVELESFVSTDGEYTVDIEDGKFVTVDIDDLVSKDFNVESGIVVANDISKEWEISSTDISTKAVAISGGSKLINKIGYVRAVATIGTGKFLQQCNCALVVYDKNGEDITSQVQSNTTECTAKVYMNGSKEVNINVEVNEVNTKDNYEIWKVKYSTEKIRILGSDNALSSVDKIDIPLKVDMNTISINNDEAIIKIPIKDYIPDGVHITNADEVLTVTLTFNKMENRVVYVDASSVELVNAPSGLRVNKGTGSIAVEVSGVADEINSISAAELKPYVDLYGKGIGKYSMSLEFRNKDIVIKKHGTINIEIVGNIIDNPGTIETPVTPARPSNTPDAAGDGGSENENTSSGENQGETGDKVPENTVPPTVTIEPGVDIDEKWGTKTE